MAGVRLGAILNVRSWRLECAAKERWVEVVLESFSWVCGRTALGAEWALIKRLGTRRSNITKNSRRGLSL